MMTTENIEEKLDFVKIQVKTGLDGENEIRTVETALDKLLINKVLFSMLTNGIGFSLFRTLLAEFDKSVTYEKRFYSK